MGMCWVERRRWCMKRRWICKHTDMTTPPPHQNYVHGLSDPLWPSQSTASADNSYTHTYAAVSLNQHTTATRNAPVPNPTSDLVLLTPYVVKGGLGVGGRREAERKATCTLCILGRPASVTRHTEEPQRQADRCSMRLSTSLGWWWWSWEIKGV